MHISRFVLWGSIGFICGIGFLSFFRVSVNTLFILVSLCTISLIVIFYDKKWTWTVIFSLLMFGVGGLVMGNVLQELNILNQKVGISIVGEAIVSGDVVQKDYNSNVTFEYLESDVSVLIKDEKYTDIIRGDIVELNCKTSLPQQIKDFDYRMYLAMHGVDYVCDDFEYVFIRHKSDLLSILAQFRLKMENVVNNIIPAPQAALANGLLFGGDDRLSDELQNKFAQTGMTHIVAVSGYNVSVIVAVVIGFVIFIGVNRKYSVIFAIIGVVFFVALIGFPSSGVRAAVMGVLILLAASFGRISHAYGAIFFTGAIMIAFNPLLLRYDVGFQLSFLATLGIVAIYPLLERYIISRNTAFGILDILILTISAQIFVLPIIIYTFKTVSVVSLLANILILPIIPVTMLLVFLMLLASVMMYPIALFLGWLAFFLLSYEIFVIDKLANISWSSLLIDDISVVWFIVYYIVVGVIVYYFNKK
jgi:competence protein ComEC